MRRDEHWITVRLTDWVGAPSSDEIRDLLKERFVGADGLEAYWLAAALLASWPEDVDVLQCVRARLFERSRAAGYLAWHVPRVVPDLGERRALILRWLRDPDVGRPEAVVDEAMNLPNAASDEEIVRVAVRRLDQPQNMYARKHILERLVAAVPKHEAVRRAALVELDDAEAALDALAGAYQHDPEFRPRLLKAGQACDLDVREALVGRLRPPISRQVNPKVLLSGAWIEIETVMRMQGALALTRFFGTSSDREDLLTCFRREALVLGTYYVQRRVAAATGMLALNAEALLRTLTDESGGPLRINLRHGNDDDVRPLARLLLSDWPKRRDCIGPEHPIRTAWSDFWAVAEPLLDEYPEALPDAEAHLREHRGPASAGLIRAISRVLPESSVLLSVCLETIKSHQTTLPDVFVAARTLADHFGGDASVETSLDEIRRTSGPWDASMWALALAYGWPESSILREVFTPGRRVSHALFFHLDRVLNHGYRHVEALETIVLRGHEGYSGNRYVLAEIVESFRRCTTSDAAFLERLLPWLGDSNRSKRISAISLFRALGWGGDAVTRAVQEIFDAAMNTNRGPHTGYDVVTNSVRTTAEVAWEYLFDESLRREAAA